MKGKISGRKLKNQFYSELIESGSLNLLQAIFLIGFIERHKLKEYMFYDAGGLAINSIKDEMKKSSALFAFNTTTCKNGHTIRSRAGHCVQCNTANISFILRNCLEGYVYIAGSLEKNIMKIGVTDRIRNRESDLNKECYSNCSDWRIIFYIYVEEAGRIEGEVKKIMKNYTTNIPYIKKGLSQISTESFYCSFNKLHKVILDIIQEEDLILREIVFNKLESERYNFPNLKRV